MRSFYKKEKWSAKGEDFHITLVSFSKTMKLVVGALLSSIAFILQSAGIFAGIGYLLSVFSTGPILLASLVSLRIGVMTYFLTILLLAMFQPSELLVFPFTTGLLGISLGMAHKIFKKRIFIISSAAICLTIGISILLYGFKFPILGPSITSHFSSVVIIGVFSFTLLYSWIWEKLIITITKFLNKVFSRNSPM